VSLVVDEHRQYLADTARVDAFDRALKAVVRPGDVVLDLASGTGILGLLACRAGAGRVYAIEMEPIVELARQIASDNGFADRIVCIQAVSTRATLPEPVDLIVTDGAGRFGFEAGLLETLPDARRRFLKPGGRTIPSALTLWLAPVEADEPRAHVDFWAQPVQGLSFAAAHAIARSTGYPRHFTTHELLAEPAALMTLDPSRETPLLSGRVELRIRRDATLHGIGGWFSATLAPGVELTNAPDAPGRINRRNVFFPLHDPVIVAAGDRVTVSMRIRPASLLVGWHVEVRGGADGHLRHTTSASTFEGMLISREDMARTRPTFQPALTPAGLARRTVLDLCDGARSLADIEREMWHRHPALFRDRDAAAAFVAEVVTRYAT
jgi:protein arginine N-methyltransferase 1